jgi:UDP-galactopyranose mutase
VKHIAVAGAGFAGAVIARELADSGKYHVTIFEERDHVAGNCHTIRDPATGVMLHRYGPHIFHTSREDVWMYVNRFGQFGSYTNRVKAVTQRGIFSLPLNLLTINQFFNKRMTPAEAQEFVARQGDRSIREPRNFEEQALKMMGRELYLNFFHGYTKKQWGMDPKELPASILQRLPMRFNYDDNYYNSKYQGIPIDGYTALVERMVDHPSITVRLRESFHPELQREFVHVFFSGPLDSYFEYSLGRLQYRTLAFERFDEAGDHQGNPVINYCEPDVPFTRISEHKHFAPWEEHERTVCFREYSKLSAPGDIPFYPIRLAQDKALLDLYVARAGDIERVSFIGRLGTYRYLDMHVVIGETLDLARICLLRDPRRHKWPTFSAEPVPAPPQRSAA